MYRRSVILFHDRSVDTAADTCRHFDKALMNLPVFDILECGDTVFHAVNGKITISWSILCHGFENPAGGREETCTAFLRLIQFRFERDAFFLEPSCQLLKRHDSIDKTFIIIRFILLRNTRTDKDRLCIRHTLFDIRTVRLHRRHDISKIFQLRREILLNQKIDRMAAGTDDDIAGFLTQHPFIFVLNDRCTERGFFYTGKAKLQQSPAHGCNTDAFIVCNEGRC